VKTRYSLPPEFEELLLPCEDFLFCEFLDRQGSVDIPMLQEHIASCPVCGYVQSLFVAAKYCAQTEKRMAAIARAHAAYKYKVAMKPKRGSEDGKEDGKRE